jgi:hypothetical protein
MLGVMGAPESRNPASNLDDRHPADVIVEMVDHVLQLAASWPRWDGRPVVVPVEGEQPRTYTPHKAIRRVTDHMIDHLAQLEARVGARSTEPDSWRGSGVTTPADLAPFTGDDLNEAQSRLRRLAAVYDIRLRSLTDEQLDAHSTGACTVR